MNNFKFKETNFARKLETEQEKEIGEEKLKEFILEIGEKLKVEGVPLTDNCRIDAKEFQGIYSKKEIENDQERVNNCEKKWQKELGAEKSKRDGEKLEMLKTALFYKFLGGNFIVVRSSTYDDIENKVDNIILEKKTGNLVCAFDEVSDISGNEYKAKKHKVSMRNIEKGGAQLKYGLKLEKNKENQIKLILGKVTKIPILYIALDKKNINKGIEELIPSFEKKSNYEKKLWNYFVASFNAQIQALELLEKHDLDPALKNRLDNFHKSIQNYK